MELGHLDASAAIAIESAEDRLRLGVVHHDSYAQTDPEFDEGPLLVQHATQAPSERATRIMDRDQNLDAARGHG
ncbi:hypothetical protein GCM10027268_21160 [Brachybacterium huguangmaarense]